MCVCVCFCHHFSLQGFNRKTPLAVRKSVTPADLCESGQRGFLLFEFLRRSRLQIVLRSHGDTVLKNVRSFHVFLLRLSPVSVPNMKSGGTVFIQPIPLQHTSNFLFFFPALSVESSNNTQRKNTVGHERKHWDMTTTPNPLPALLFLAAFGASAYYFQFICWLFCEVFHLVWNHRSVFHSSGFHLTSGPKPKWHKTTVCNSFAW